MNISRQSSIGALVSAVLANAGGAHAQSATDAHKPNDTIVFVNDLGWTNLGCYGARVARRLTLTVWPGRRMVSRACSSCNVCSPTRTSLMAGTYPQRVGFTRYLCLNKQRA